MNKKLMAVAVAGALSAPGLAVAQVGGSPGVTLYGVIDSSILRNKFSAVTTPNGTTNVSDLTKSDVFPSGNRVGVRGREDLGGGTALWFQLEAGAWADGRTEQTANTGVMFGGRNSGIGVSTSAMGDVMWGGWDAPYKVSTDQTYNLQNSGPFSSSGIILGNGDTTGAAPNAFCGSTIANSSGNPFGTGGAAAGAAVATCATEVTGSTKSFHRRLNNTIQYWSPVFNGVQFKLATQVANYQSPSNATVGAGEVQKPKLYSGNVVWTRGPAIATFGYESHEGYNPGTQADGIANSKDTAIQIGGKYDFGMGQVGVGYEQLKYAANRSGAATANGYKQANYVVNGRFNVGPGAIWAGYTKTPGGKSCDTGAAVVANANGGSSAVCGSASEAKQISVGYDYILSKRTKMYVAYSKIDNGAGTNYYYIAGPAANEGGAATALSGANNTFNGTAGGLIPGTDVTTIGVGLQHSF